MSKWMHTCAWVREQARKDREWLDLMDLFDRAGEEARRVAE